MKLAVFLILFTSFQAVAINSLSQERIDLNLKNKTIVTVLKDIESNYSYRFFYNDSVAVSSQRVDVYAKNATIDFVMQQLLQATSFSYKKINDGLYVIIGTDIIKPILPVTGSITDATGNPIAGASVIEKGTTNGTTTSDNGTFTIDVKDNNAILVISAVGYEDVEIGVADNQNPLIVLKATDSNMDEVVVIGYGVQKKKLVTGATSQVRGDDLKKLNAVSPVEGLKANTTGVQIIKSSGQPGSKFSIAIRGKGTAYDYAPLYIVDGMAVGDIEFLNPADIESVDILKDAASASIYGSRAANGVVLITTKRGALNSRSVITYDFHYGNQNLYKTMQPLNAKQYALIMNEASLNDMDDPFDFASMVPWWSEIENGSFNGTNWLEEIRVKDAPTRNHSLSVNGGGKNAIYAMGLSYTDQYGVLGKPATPYYKRYTGRFSGEYNGWEVNGRDLMKLGGSMVFTHTTNNGIGIGNMYGNSIRNVLTANPFLKVYDEDGNYHKSISWRINEPNPIGVMDYGSSNNENKNNHLLGNAFVELSPIKSIRYRSSIGVTQWNGSWRGFTPVYELSPITRNERESVSQSMWTGYSVLWENTLTYNTNIGLHNIEALAGTAAQKTGMGGDLSASNVLPIMSGLKFAYITNTRGDIAPANTSIGGSPTLDHRLLSYFGRVAYNYAEKYMLMLIMRGDASSNFAPDKRWGYFPSLSAGWVVTEENFMKDLLWLNTLKLRFGWGQNGNQNIDPFQYLSTIGYAGGNVAVDYFGTDKTKRLIGAYPNILPNPDVTWETSEQTNFGIDATFLKNRLTLAFDIYQKITKDWLVRAPALASFGTTAPYINGGDISNKGIELGINWRGNISDINYHAGVNFSYNKNKVTRIANAEGILHGPPNVLGQGMTELFRAQVGYPIGYFWGYKTDGLFQNEEEVKAYTNSKGQMIMPDARAGDVKFVNMNDDNIINELDKVMIGDPNPDYTFGLNAGADYKGFYFSIIGNGVAGNQIARSYRTPDVPKNNYTTEIFERWHGPGTSNRIPRVTASTHPNTQYVSDLYIEDGSYFRIQNLTIGYDVKRLWTKMPLQQVRLYTSFQNLYTFTKYKGMDPEIGYNGGMSFGSGIDLGFYPIPRTVIFGLSIKF